MNNRESGKGYDPLESRREVNGLWIEKLESILNRTSFVQSPRLEQLSRDLLNGSENIKAFMTEWAKEAEGLVELLPSEKQPEAQVGLIVAQVVILLKGDFAEEANDAIEDAIDLAYQFGMNQLVEALINKP